MEDLLTAGQFAKLARTTKRTIIWYDKEGILKPFKTSEAYYRYYKPEQIIDFQVILLLRRLNFTLPEVKEYLRKNKNLKDLFKSKREFIEKELKYLQKSLNDTENYYKNLSANGTLVKPVVKNIKSFDIYYLEKVGAYAKIKDYCLELKSYFEKKPKNCTFLSIFKEHGYKPNNAKIKISIVIEDGMQLKEGSEKVVKREKIPSFKALSYTHIGSGALLSLLWRELGKYRREKGYELAEGLEFVDLEFYRKTSLNGFPEEEEMEFEICLPIE